MMIIRKLVDIFKKSKASIKQQLAEEEQNKEHSHNMLEWDRVSQIRTAVSRVVIIPTGSHVQIVRDGYYGTYGVVLGRITTKDGDGWAAYDVELDGHDWLKKRFWSDDVLFRHLVDEPCECSFGRMSQ